MYICKEGLVVLTLTFGDSDMTESSVSPGCDMIDAQSPAAIPAYTYMCVYIHICVYV